MAADALRSDGLARVDGVLDADTAAALAAFVNRTLVSARFDVDGGVPEQSRFGAVLSRTNRYDLLMPLDEPIVRQALAQAIEPLRDVLERSLGADAELFELSALVSDPGAPRQPLHPDTGWRNGRGTAVCTAFVALQPIDADMGPTVWLPRSHTEKAHATFNAGAMEKTTLLRQSTRRLGLLGQGDACLFDSRLLHAGGANVSPRRRILFYFSFKAAGERAPPGSLFRTLSGKWKLNELSAELSGVAG